MIIENIDSVAGHFYAVTIPELPEGDSYSWKDNVVQGIHFPFGGAIEGTNQYDVGISHHPPLPTLEYPIDVDREFTFSIIDESTNESVEGLDVELALMCYDTEIVNKYNYVKTLDTWNTSDDLHHSIALPLHFDSDYDQSYLWGIKINNMPDGYMYRDIVCDDHMVNGSYSVGKYKRDLYNNKEVTDYSYFIKPIDYQPVYSTTVTSEKTTAVTTTTTTTATEPIEGDANCDGQLNMADAVLIMQSLANPDKYGTNGTDERHLTAQGEKNADITGDNDGVTNADALAIQKKLLGLD